MHDADLVEYKGSHGTTVERWLSIKDTHSFHFGLGERGTGAYFWEDNIYAKTLAVAWYITAKKRGEYSKDGDQRCAVIWAKLKADKNDTIDLAAPEYHKSLYELLKRIDHPDNRYDAHKLYDEFYERVESVLKRKIKLVIASVYPPNAKGVNVFPTQTVGMAPCYIARDEECIRELSCEELEDYNVSNTDTVKKILEEIKNET